MEPYEHCRVLEAEACMNRDDLRQLSLPEGLEEIGEAAFAACENLELLTLPATVRVIGPGAFLHCRSLRQIVLPPSVQEVGDMAFFGCEALERAQVQNPDCALGLNVFGGFYAEKSEEEELELYGGSPESNLRSALLPPRFPQGAEEHEKLLYALLWCAEGSAPLPPEAAPFLEQEADRAFAFLLRKRREDLLEALLRRGLIPAGRFADFVRKANDAALPEFASLLLRGAARSQTAMDIDEEFAL